jgi:hypothetical protein
MSPDVQPRITDGAAEIVQVALGEPAAEIAGRGRIGDRVGADRIQEDFVVPPQLQVLQAGGVAQGVEGQVQHVVRLVIEHVQFEEVQPAVDGLDQPHFGGQRDHQPDALVGDAAGLVGQFVLHARRIQYGARISGTALLFVAVGTRQAIVDPPLAIGQSACDAGLHSKSSVRGRDGKLITS